MAGETKEREKCIFHGQPLMTIHDMEFYQFFGIKEAKVFCCPLLGCDYISFGMLIQDNDLILSAERHILLLMFARQKAVVEKLASWAEDGRKINEYSPQQAARNCTQKVIKSENLRTKLTWDQW